MKKIAVLQSAYIPWKGYFDLINSVDEFIIYDDVQYSKGDWRNRNRLKSKKGLRWITIPVNLGGLWPLNIDKVTVSNNNWNLRHWDTIKQIFRGSQCYEEGVFVLEPLYKAESESFLAEINIRFTTEICKYLYITTPILNSRDFHLEKLDKNERLLELCIKANANVYVSGPAGKNYLDHDLFAGHGVKIEYFYYANYREYPQLFEGFTHQVSIIDMIFNLGINSSSYIKGKLN